jgi:uncharacterized membrane protein YfcA
MVVDGGLWLAAAVVFLAALTHGAAGFGAALVAMPLLVMAMDIRIVTPLVALLTLTVNAIFLVRFRRSLRPGRVVPLLPGAAVGVPIGIFLLKTADPRPLELLLGTVLVTYSVFSLRRHRREGRPAAIGRPWAFFLGLCSGCLGGAINTGGPPAVVYAVSQPWSKEEIHVSLQFYFFLSGIFIVAAHALTGLTTATTVRYYFLMLPALMAGSAAGYVLHRRTSGDHYRKVVFSLLLVLGILLFVR